MTRKPAAVHGEEAGVPLDLGSHGCSEKMVAVYLQARSKVLWVASHARGLSTLVTGFRLRTQITNPRSK